MAQIDVVMVVPKQYPELKQLAWNRDVDRAISGEEAFALYERNWRHVDKDRIQPHEVGLIAQLTQAYGRGRLLA